MITTAVVQNRNDLHEAFLREQAVPNVVPKGVSTHATQTEAANGTLVRVGSNPIKGCLDRIKTAFSFVRRMLVVVTLDIKQVALCVGKQPDGVGHADRCERRRSFHSSSVMKSSGFASASATRSAKSAH